MMSQMLHDSCPSAKSQYLTSACEGLKSTLYTWPDWLTDKVTFDEYVMSATVV